MTDNERSALIELIKAAPASVPLSFKHDPKRFPPRPDRSASDLDYDYKVGQWAEECRAISDFDTYEWPIYWAKQVLSRLK